MSLTKLSPRHPSPFPTPDPVPSRPRRRPARFGALAAALAVTLVATACTGTWGIRKSYRDYVTGPVAGGAITATDGATWLNGSGTGKGPFLWSVQDSAYNPATEVGYVQMTGTVRTVGHAHSSGGWVLDLTVANPRLEIDGDTGTLVVDLNYRPYAGFDPPTLPAMQAALDVPFATVDLSGQNLVPDANGAYKITNAPTVGIPAAMELISWDDFYGSNVSLDPLSITFTPAPPGLAPTPKVVVSATDDVLFGDTITVSGSGFDPAANIGTRPPLAGQPAGVYVVFGKFADTWRPSQGAPSSARTVVAQKWALPPASRALLDPSGTNPAFVTIDSAGRFQATLTLGSSSATGNYGVYVYPGSGAVNAAHELAVPISVS